MAAVFIISFPSDFNEQAGMRIQEILDFVTEICTESFIQVRNGYLTKPYFISLTNSRTNMVSFKIIFTPEASLVCPEIIVLALPLLMMIP